MARGSVGTPTPLFPRAWFLHPADFGAVGDGATDDTSAFQDALDAAADRVLFLPPDRTYRVGTVYPASGSTITGGGTIDLIDDGTSASTVVYVSGVDGVTIDNIRITQSNATSRTSNYGLIRGENSTNCVVRNCYLGTHTSTLIWLGRCSHWLLANNYGTGSWADGFHISRQSTHIRVVGNEFNGVRDDAIAVNSILADGATSHNPCTDILIANNVCTGTLVAGNGIAVNGGERITITGNVVRAPVSNGIYVGAVFSGNQETHPWRDVTVAGNTVYDVDTPNSGIVLTGESGAPGKRGVVVGNVVNTASEATAIYADYVDFGVFHGNSAVVSGAGHGVHVLHNNYSSVMGNVVSGPGSSTTSSGVLLNGCAYTVAAGNVVNGCQVGVYEINSTNPVVVANNVLQGNTGSAVNGTLLGTSVYRGNQSYNPRGNVSVSVPSSGVAVAAINYDRVFYVTANAGGATTCAVGASSVVVPAGGCVAVHVPAGVTMTPSYSSAPTWVVYGL